MFNLNFTKMKKLIALFSLLLIVGFSVNVMAQSTGTAPYPGATHTYSVTDNPSADYVWKIYKGTHATEITAVGNGIAAATFSSTTNSINITWATTASPTDVYLVEVIETLTANGCSNTKALPVTITASSFDLTVSATNGCYNSPVTVAWTGTPASLTYDHGAATITWGVAIVGIGATETCTFKPNFGAISGVTYGTPVVKQGATTLTPNAGVYTATGTTAVTVEVTADNTNSYNNSSSATAQDLAITMSLDNITSGTGSVEKSVGGGANSAVLNVTRPSTTQITTTP
jgi:hypothetical protein